MLRGRLLRSARLLLDWSQARLACEAGISSGTVHAVEAGRLSVESPAARAMVQALERGGVLLVPSCKQLGPGLRYAPDHARRQLLHGLAGRQLTGYGKRRALAEV